MLHETKEKTSSSKGRDRRRRLNRSLTATPSTWFRDEQTTKGLFMSLVCCCIVSVGGKLTGPKVCPSDKFTVGYSDLTTLRTDILLNSNITSGDKGGQYILCPDTVFNFSNVPEPTTDDLLIFDDDILGGRVDAKAQADEIQAVVLTSSNTTLLCGEDGLSSNSCVFVAGSFHILISGGPTGVLVQGVTFRQANSSSIVYSGLGGEVIFRDCIWQENRGNGAFLAIDTEVETPKPTSAPSGLSSQTSIPTSTLFPSSTRTPSSTAYPTMSSTPTISPFPTQTLSPTRIGGTDSPSISPGPSITPIPSSGPTVTPQPTTTLFPTDQPIVSVSPTVELSLTQNPTLTFLPTLEGTKTAMPTRTAAPSATQVPSGLPSTSPAPTSSSVPTISKDKDRSIIPSLTAQPSRTESPTSPTASPAPSSNVSGTGTPTVTEAPTQTEVPTDIGSVTATPSSSVPTSVSISPAPSSTVSTTGTPTGTETPTQTEMPTDIGSVTTTPSSSVPTSVSISPAPSSTESGTGTPTVTETPTQTEVPTDIGSLSTTPSTPSSSMPSTSQSLTMGPTSSSISPAPSSSLSVTVAPTSTNQPSSIAPTAEATPAATPSLTGRPTVTSRPSSIAPTEEATPAATPSLTGRPTVTSRPSTRDTTTSAPSVNGSGVPSGTPSASPKPTLTGDPSTGLTSFPSEGPSTTAKPSTTATPTLASPASIVPSRAPTNTKLPSLSQTPTTEPTISSSPTLSKGPSFSPSVSPNPSASSAPSVGPSPLSLTASISLEPSRVTASPSSTLARDSLRIVERNDDRFDFAEDNAMQVILSFPDDKRHWRSLQEPDSFSVTIADCLFENNDHAVAVILTFRGGLSVLSTEFMNNTSKGAMVALFAGQLSMENATFVDNHFEFLPSLVFLDEKSKLKSNLDNCADNNEGGENSPPQTCNGIFLQTEPGDCFNVDECVGVCQNFTSQACVIVECYSDWKQLSLAIQTASSDGMSGTFELCSDTLFDVDEYPDPKLSPIVISEGGTVIRCGKDGSRDNNCVVLGGTQQFVVEGSPSKNVFVGVTFLSSSKTSISANGDSTADVTFIDCGWSNHTGSSVIEIYFEGIDQGDVSLSDIPAPKDMSMTVLLVNCSVVGNALSYSSISNFNGIFYTERTLFSANVAPGGAIISFFSGQVALTSTCFIDTRSDELPGSVFVQQTSLVLKNEKNFGAANNSTHAAKCNAIFTEIDGSCVDDNGCDGDCLAFTAKRCEATDFVESVSPSPAPSLPVSSEIPTALPVTNSDMPSLSLRPSSNGCFTKWDALSAAVGSASSSGEGETFIICPNTVMNVDFFSDEEITPIIVGAGGIVIQCGSDGIADNNCLIFGGQSHFSIVESAAQVEFRGLKFVGATGNSINALGNSSASATFYECTFSRGQGTAVIFLYGGSLEYSLDDDSALLEKQGEAMSLQIVNCTFSDNDVDMAPVVNVGGTVTVELTVFRSNDGEVGAIIVLASGSLSVSDSCFLSNTATVGAGAILLEVNSTLVVAEGNFGRGNKALGNLSCTEIAVLAVDDVKCIPFDSEDCLVTDLPPTPSPTTYNITSIVPSLQPSFEIPSAVPLECFAAWDTLSKALRAASKADTGGTFTLCEDSFFDVSAFPETSISPIVISSSDVTIQCGEVGEQGNNCTVSGGVNQFMIRGTVSNVNFLGISFVASMGIAVHAAGTENSNASFVDCKWRANEGTSAVLILQVTASRAITKSMAVKIVNSNFTDNDVVEGAVLNVGGTLVVDRTIFLRNSGGKGAIGILDEGELAVTRSCFVNNAGSGEDATGGIITLQDNSTLSLNENNFGVGNDGCSGILMMDDENDVICGRACTEFTAKECAVVDIPVGEFPTASPSETQTLPPLCFESDVPTGTPNPTITPVPTTSFSPSITIVPSVNLTESNEPTTSSAPSSTKHPTPVSSEPTTSPAPSLTKHPTPVSSEPTASPAPSLTKHPTQTVAPSATASSLAPTSSVAPSSAPSPPQMFSVSATPTVTGKPTSSAAPSGTPKPSTIPLSTVPTTVQSQAPSSTSQPSGVSSNTSIAPSSSPTNTGGPTAVSESPTALETEMPAMSMSFSYDYFFYNYG